jgi:hypothetical protein
MYQAEGKKKSGNVTEAYSTDRGKRLLRNAGNHPQKYLVPKHRAPQSYTSNSIFYIQCTTETVMWTIWRLSCLKSKFGGKNRVNLEWHVVRRIPFWPVFIPYEKVRFRLKIFSRTFVTRNLILDKNIMVTLRTGTSVSIYQTGNEHGRSGKTSGLDRGRGPGLRKIRPWPLPSYFPIYFSPIVLSFDAMYCIRS